MCIRDRFHAVCEAELVVAHSPHTDFLLLYTVGHMLPQRPFCTQVAADFLGIGDSIGLGDLLVKELGVPLEKRYSNSNWAARPLAPAMLEYAVGDVEHLLELQSSLQHQLDSSGPHKPKWFRDEMASKFLQPSIILDTLQPTDAWRKLPLRVLRKLDTQGLYCAMQLAAWREKRSVDRNMNPAAVLTDSVIHALANQRPADWEDLKGCGPLKDSVRMRLGLSLIHISEPTRLLSISYAVFCLKKKKYIYYTQH
eukprot:TRINITY_DN38124_c0_g1_i1.p1 TRINITY_DN38124_c0_g1~~TRINITY_DN38124_c0_g1_i1.p1  ORF type:complete len:253 (+),score=58.36 TRINITY_DN38124_c0_g1_i1:108-866(+)